MLIYADVFIMTKGALNDPEGINDLSSRICSQHLNDLTKMLYKSSKKGDLFPLEALSEIARYFTNLFLWQQTNVNEIRMEIYINKITFKI